MATRRPRKPPVAGRRQRPAPGARLRPARFIVVTGLAGAGKSQAIHALEDLGYFCVDNLPTTLLPTLAALTVAGGGGDHEGRGGR